MLVAPSWGGALISLAACFAFLTRQPLRLALQDANRGKSYPRTGWCWTFVAIYLAAAAAALAGAIAVGGAVMLIPLGLVAPFALVQVLFDAHARGRNLLPELCGATAMSSTAAAIGIAGGLRIMPAFILSGIIICRMIPSIVYVRTLVRREHKQIVSPWPAAALQIAAIALVVSFASPLAALAMVILLVRAIWGLTHEPPRAKTLGWREVVFGAVTVVLAAL